MVLVPEIGKDQGKELQVTEALKANLNYKVLHESMNSRNCFFRDQNQNMNELYYLDDISHILKQCQISNKERTGSMIN